MCHGPCIHLSGRNSGQWPDCGCDVEEGCVLLCSDIYWRVCQRRNLPIPSRYLLKQMQATPGHPRATKGEFEKTCRRRFHVTLDSFEYCWREAIKASGARWDQPGRRPR
jgi:hypothetical protein